MKSRIVLPLLAVTAFSTVFLNQSAQAAGFQLKEQSADGQGVSFAGSTAKALDPSTIFFNPAGMTRLKGNQAEASVSYIAPHFKFNFESQSGTVGPFTRKDVDGGKAAFVPAAYGVWDYQEDLKFGVSVNVPFGLSTEYDKNWTGGQYNRKSAIESIAVTPSVAYRVNDQFSVGGGITVQHVTGELTRTATSVFGGDVKLAASDVGFGYTLGTLYEYSDAGRVGLSYRSRIKHRLDGDVNITGATNPAVNDSYDAYADVTLPDILSAGWYHQVDGKWAVMSDVAWTNWSVWKQLDVQRKSTGALASSTEYHFSDTYFASLGASYQYSDTVKLQAGVAFDKGAANDTYRNAGMPDSDRRWLSFGVEFKPAENMMARIGVSHIWGKDAYVSEDSKLNSPAAGLGTAYSGSFDASVDIINIGVTMDF